MEGFARRLAVWWRASRFHYIPPSYLPAILGAVAAASFTGRFHFPYLAVTVAAVTVNHAALNMTDDYFDFRHSVDRARTSGDNPYSGGSGTLTSGRIRPARMRLVFFALYSLTALAGLYLAVERGWPVLAFGLFGALSSWFYTAPPLRYGYHGFGEVSQLVNFSLTIGLGSFYVQARQLSLPAAVLLLPLGFMMFSMITINEIPDEPEDRQGGKRNLVVRFGRRMGVRLYAAGMAAAFAVILAAPWIAGASYWTWLGLLPCPWFLKALSIARRHYRDPLRMSPANRLTIRIHGLTGALLIVSLLLPGRAGSFPPAATRSAWALLPLAALSFPVILAVFRPRGGKIAEGGPEPGPAPTSGSSPPGTA